LERIALLQRDAIVFYLKILQVKMNHFSHQCLQGLEGLKETKKKRFDDFESI